MLDEGIEAKKRRVMLRVVQEIGFRVEKRIQNS